jgi:hypothetical protein
MTNGPVCRESLSYTIYRLYRELAEQRASAAALGEELAALRTTLDQAEQGDGLAPWRRVFDDDSAESEE